MKFAKIAIFLTGMIGLALGGVMTISSLRSQQEETQLRTYDHLKSQAQVLVDQFYGAIETTKSLSQSNIPNGTLSLQYVTHVGVVKLLQGVPSEFESLVSRDSVGKDSIPDLILEDRVMKGLRATLASGDLQISKFAMGTFEPSELSNREGILIATPIYRVNNGVVDPTVLEKINLTLIDPPKMMASLGKIAGDHRAAYLIDRSGRVMAHSSNSFLGSELKKIDGLKDSIENLFLGAQTGVVTQYHSVEGRREQVAFLRTGAFPFAIGAEQSAPPAVLSSAWWSDESASGAARKTAGSYMVLIAIALALFAGASFILGRSSESSAPRAQEFSKSQSQNFQRWTAELRHRNEKAITETPPEFVIPASISKAASNAAEAFVENRANVNQEVRESEQQAKRIVVARNYEHEFVERIKTNYTLETIEQELASVSSELTESPVLYFRYHRQTQNLNLAAVSGQVQIPNYALMQAYVRKDIENQVERLASEGRVASISNYGPMSKLMIGNLNTAHFEAWVVTSNAEMSGTSKMVGVLVVLQAGFRSAQTRPVLANLLKDAGNYLFAQTSKLRPRGNTDTAVNTKRDRGLNHVD